MRSTPMCEWASISEELDPMQDSIMQNNLLSVSGQALVDTTGKMTVDTFEGEF